jgi:hypothetical protein
MIEYVICSAAVRVGNGYRHSLLSSTMLLLIMLLPASYVVPITPAEILYKPKYKVTPPIPLGYSDKKKTQKIEKHKITLLMSLRHVLLCNWLVQYSP